MPALAEVATAHAEFRGRIAATVAAEAGQAWQQVDPARISETWLARMARLLVLLTGAQRVVAGQADTYLDVVLTEQRIDPAAAGATVAEALSGVASDGRGLDGLLYRPVVAALSGIARGVAADRALAGGSAVLDMIVRTQVADAGRAADQVALTARPKASGYVRMLAGSGCSRCVVLAGRWYAFNTGFDRHPACACIHIPGRENTTGDQRTDPKVFFDNLSAAEQDRVFTKAGAEAIRLGSDIGQVVNARRGAAGLTPAGARITADEARMLRGGRDVGRLQAQQVFGQDVFTTTEGVTRRGVAGRGLGSRTPRLMPESILRIAGSDRAEAVRLLRRFGFIR